MGASMRRLFPLLSLLLANPLLGQSPGGLIQVARGSDGTAVFIDSAHVTRSGDSSFVVATEIRFATPVGTERPANREVDVDQMDCAGQRSQALGWALYRDSTLVSSDLGAPGWTAWTEEGAPLSRLVCTRLLEGFGALPVEHEMEGLDRAPELTNPVAVGRALEEQYPPTLRGTEAGRGVAAVRVLLDAAGVPREPATWVMFAPHPEFAQAARRVVAEMRFRPARLNGAPVPVWITLPIRFEPQ
jgi:hypothetical protein